MESVLTRKLKIRKGREGRTIGLKEGQKGRLRIHMRYSRRGLIVTALKGAKKPHGKEKGKYCVSTVLTGTVSHCIV